MGDQRDRKIATHRQVGVWHGTLRLLRCIRSGYRPKSCARPVLDLIFPSQGYPMSMNVWLERGLTNGRNVVPRDTVPGSLGIDAHTNM